MKHRTLAVVASGVGAAIAMAGCSGDAGADVSASPDESVSASPSASPADEQTEVEAAGARLQGDIYRIMNGNEPLYPATQIEATGQSGGEYAFGRTVIRSAPELTEVPAQDLISIGYRACDLMYLAGADVDAAMDAIRVQYKSRQTTMGAVFMEAAVRTLCTPMEPDFDAWISTVSVDDWAAGN